MGSRGPISVPPTLSLSAPAQREGGTGLLRNEKAEFAGDWLRKHSELQDLARN